MKKTCSRLFLTILLIAFLLLSTACGKSKLAKTSDYSEEIAEPLPEAVLPVEETADPPVLAEEGEGIEKGGANEVRGDGGETSAATASPYRYIAPASDLDGYLATCATAGVNVRRGAGTGYASLFTVSAGDSLPYLWREGEWIAVWTGERVGYLSSAYAFVTETNGAIERTIRAGLKKLGTPYEWGATRLLDDKGQVSPYFTGKSFDCSSFVQYCYYKGFGIKLGAYTGSQVDHTVGKKIYNYADLKRGDFYFTGSGGTVSHVVIYLGKGYLLQTYSANGGPVSVTADDRWRSKFISGRRPDPTVIEQFG